MNSRIQELIKQVGTDTSGKWIGIDNAEKLCQLIVNECTQLLFEEAERLYAYSSECDIMSRSDDAELSAEKCMDNIKMIEEHFKL